MLFILILYHIKYISSISFKAMGKVYMYSIKSYTLTNMQYFPTLYQANVKITFLLIPYSLSIFSPSAFQFHLLLQMYFANTEKVNRNY